MPESQEITHTEFLRNRETLDLVFTFSSLTLLVPIQIGCLHMFR